MSRPGSVTPARRGTGSTPSVNPNLQEDPSLMRRLTIVQDLKAMEASYVQLLDVLVANYYHNLLSWAETENLPDITKDQITTIFRNVDQILIITKHMYDGICARANNWTPTQKMGDIFVKMFPYFKHYQVFVTTHLQAEQMLLTCQQNARFVQLVDHIAVESNSMQLDSLLIQPIQRILAYRMRLDELLTNTDQNHPDFNDLRQAIAIFDQFIESFEANLSDDDNYKRLYQSVKAKIASKPTAPGKRLLILEGIVNIKPKEETMAKKLASGKIGSKDEKIQLWLFNDALVHKSTKAKNRIATEYSWPLELVWLKDNPEVDSKDKQMPYNFTLVGPGKIYTLKFPEMTEKREWFKKITEATEKVLNEENAPDDIHRYSYYRFPNGGGEYEGWWRFGRIHGEGVFKFFGNKYSGEWEYNKKCGQGVFESVTNEVYEGQWLDDKPHGYGIITFANKDRYEGYWEKGMRCGKGVLYYHTGDQYNGEWGNNNFCGEGTYITTTNFVYRGGWLDGRPHGHGILISPNGRQYEGEFKNGMRHGEGKLDYANGDFYIGQWKEDRKHGKGLLHSSVDGIYVGYFVNDMRDGNGRMEYTNGDVYDGHWKKDMYHGQGTLHVIAGGMEKYEGNWEAGKEQGKGVLFYRNGARYEGQFKDGRPHGSGVQISVNAVVMDGKWNDGAHDGKTTISVGPSKFPGTIQGGIIDYQNKGGAYNFLVIPLSPAIQLHL